VEKVFIGKGVSFLVQAFSKFRQGFIFFAEGFS
jgi:hypothetical protein